MRSPRENDDRSPITKDTNVINPEEELDNINEGAEGEYIETVVEYVDNRKSRGILAALLVLLTLLLIGVTYIVYTVSRPVNPPRAEQLPEGIEWVRSIYAWGTTAETVLSAPIDVAIAPDGTIWTTSNKTMIVGFDPQGNPVGTITMPFGEGPGQFYSLEGLDVDEDGNIWVCDYGKGAVMVFSPQGELLREFGVQSPIEVAVRNGNVAIAAAAGIAITDMEGELITKWGARGKGDGDFDLPHGIDISDDGTVLVSDTQNRRIKAYSLEGRLLWTHQTKVTDEGLRSRAESETVDGVAQTMSLPAGMTFDGVGRLLVVDPFEFQILAVDTGKEGQIVARYGADGAEDGLFAYPTGIDYDSNRDIVAVADTANNRIQIIRLPGTGGSLVGRTLSAVSDAPLWLCALPLLLLVAAIFVAASARKRRRS